MVMRYADPFDTLFAFQQALENRQLSEWLGSSTAGMEVTRQSTFFSKATTLSPSTVTVGDFRSREATRAVVSAYPPRVRSWIRRHGGLTNNLILLRGSELTAFYPRCRG
jgi:hypothetical protein